MLFIESKIGQNSFKKRLTKKKNQIKIRNIFLKKFYIEKNTDENDKLDLLHVNKSTIYDIDNSLSQLFN